MTSFIAKALVLVALSLIAWNLSKDSETSTSSSAAVPSPRATAAVSHSSPAPVAKTAVMRDRLAAVPASLPAENREAIRQLVEELEEAVEHGVDPDGEDARTYAEAIQVLLDERRPDRE